MKEFFKRLFAFLFIKKNKVKKAEPSIQTVTSKTIPHEIKVTSTPPPSVKPVPAKKPVPEKVKAAPLKSFKPKPSRRKHLMDFTESRYLMKNNRLHIEYSGGSLTNGANTFWDRMTGKIVKAESMYKGRIESMHCKRLYRAQEIVKGIQAHCIYRATFTDHAGQQYQII